jgi:hypothetical protein
VVITARFAVDDFPTFQASLTELSNGTIQPEIIESGDVLMPLSEK